MARRQHVEEARRLDEVRAGLSRRVVELPARRPTRGGPRLGSRVSLYLSVYLSICLSIYLSICLSVYLQAAQEAEGPMAVAVFSHGIAIRSFVRGILGADAEFTVHAETDNCSLTVLEYRPGPADLGGLGGWVLKCFNA